MRKKMSDYVIILLALLISVAGVYSYKTQVTLTEILKQHMRESELNTVRQQALEIDMLIQIKKNIDSSSIQNLNVYLENELNGRIQYFNILSSTGIDSLNVLKNTENVFEDELDDIEKYRALISKAKLEIKKKYK